jgi:hypothetical protein
MKSFYVSAKTGDNVNTCFHKVAADLAGITLSKPEVYPKPNPKPQTREIQNLRPEARDSKLPNPQTPNLDSKP